MNMLKYLGISLILVAAWLVVSPGVFVQQPIGFAPEGVTLIYYGRPSTLPLIASADGMCLQSQGYVSVWCRLGALAGITGLKDHIIVRLPYSETAYLWTTGGQTFDR
jgi:hypothetical protein